MGRLLVDGEPGTDFVPELASLPGEIVVAKPGKGAFYATKLDGMLRAAGIRQLVFAGVTTEVCVQTTMREAHDRGYECLLAEDATESYFPEFKRAVIEMIRPGRDCRLVGKRRRNCCCADAVATGLSDKGTAFRRVNARSSKAVSPGSSSHGFGCGGLCPMACRYSRHSQVDVRFWPQTANVAHARYARWWLRPSGARARVWRVAAQSR